MRKKIFLSFVIIMLMLNVIGYPIFGVRSKQDLSELFSFINIFKVFPNQTLWFDTGIEFDEAYLEVKRLNLEKSFCVYPAHGYFSEYIAGFLMGDLKKIVQNHTFCNKNGLPLLSNISNLPEKGVKCILLIDQWAEPELFQGLVSNGWQQHRKFTNIKINRNVLMMIYKKDD